MKSKTFCILPWNQLSVDIDGNTRVCCNSSNGHLLDDNGDTINLNTADDVFNNKQIKIVRQEMLDGVWPSACDRCKIDEENGISSYRELSNRIHATTVDKFENPTTEFHQLEYLNLDIGRKCNLACRMCGPQSSTLWQRQKGQIPVEKAFYDYDTIKRHLANIKTDIKRAYVIGGEPLIIPEFFTLLERLVEDGYAQHMDLSFNTNMTVWKSHWAELFNKFKHVTIQCSIDGVGPVFDYIRWPTTWQTVHDNFLQCKADVGSNVKVSITFTLQNLNVGNLPQFYDVYGNEVVHINVLHHPSYMYFTNVPQAVYEQTLAANLPGYVKQILESQQVSTDPMLKERFIREMLALDYKRNENLFDLEDFKAWKR